MEDKMVKIECLLCGGDVKIPANTDTEQYDGDGICEKCESLIHVKLVKGKVQKYKVVENKSKQTKSLTYAELSKSATELDKKPRDILADTEELSAKKPSEKATDVATGES